jgi:hypothetical protein
MGVGSEEAGSRGRSGAGAGASLAGRAAGLAGLAFVGAASSFSTTTLITR